MKEYSLLKSYKEQPDIWDEMFSSSGSRSSYKNFVSAIEDLSVTEMNHKDDLAKKLFMSQGITFTVYS
ncbi:MAG: circularly permuted type 2 ATP-grasp protein, partial [Segetibacter sp.]